MEIVAVIIGFWFVLVATYLALIVVAAYRRRKQARGQAVTAMSRVTARADWTPDQGRSAEGGISSEVDLLRVQVETLRSEMIALHGEPRAEKARLRRYRSGQYTELPRTLRRQVREVRNFRHPLGV